MLDIVKQLLERIEGAKSLETAQAYASAALLMLGASENASVVLEGISDGQKINVIKELRDIFKLGLKEAKDDSETPAKKYGPFPRQEANRIAAQLTRAGATTRVVSNGVAHVS